MDITGDVKKTMRKIRVLHKINSQIGGVEKYVFNNLKYIDRNKFEFDVLKIPASISIILLLSPHKATDYL